MVKIETVHTEMVPQTEEFSATVQANVVNNIAPMTPGRITSINAEVGDHVRKGQLLVQMEETNLMQQLSQLENLKVEFERTQALFEKGGASRSEFDARKTSYEVAKTMYDNLLENTRLISPIDGIVTARYYDSDDLYGAQRPILTVQEIAPVKLYINVSESLYTKVKKGMPVHIRLDVFGEQEFEGKVSIVYPVIDPATRTFKVEVKIENRNEQIKPGMFGRVTMNFGDRESVVVPDRAIVRQSGSGERFIYVYKDGKVSYEKIELGRRMENRYELLSGVENGASVVVVGQTRLVDGVEVRLMSEEK